MMVNDGATDGVNDGIILLDLLDSGQYLGIITNKMGMPWLFDG